MPFPSSQSTPHPLKGLEKRGQDDILVGREFALHATNLSSILSILSGPLSTAGNNS